MTGGFINLSGVVKDEEQGEKKRKMLQSRNSNKEMESGFGGNTFFF